MSMERSAMLPPARDIFISYSHTDRAWVSSELLPKLEGSGLSVLIDFKDFSAGAFGIEQMENAVTNCRKIVLVLTPKFVESEWCKLENVMAQTLDPGASRRKLIPILKERCDLPLRLRTLHYRNLTANDPEEWNLLIRDLL